MKYPLVLVRWVDIAGNSTYWNEDNDYGPCEVVSIGWLVDKNKEFIALTQSIADDTDFGGIISIPVGVVKKIKKIHAS